MLVTLLLSLPSIRRTFFEIWRALHIIISFATIAALCYHLGPRKFPQIVYLATFAGLWMFGFVLRTFLSIYRTTGGKCQATIQTFQEVVKITVEIPRPWKFRSGQWVYLCLPGNSPHEWFQQHPFMITWWEKKPDSIVFLVQPHNGFTNRVRRLAAGPWKAIIEGPYGKELDFGSYGTILMFATGFGIAGQLPYIKALFEGCKRGEVVTRRISLFWQINGDEEVLLECVKDWMDELLRRDTGYVCYI